MFVIELIYKADLTDIDAHMNDPFHEHRLADFRIIEFRASQRADDMPERITAS